MKDTCDGCGFETIELKERKINEYGKTNIFKYFCVFCYNTNDIGDMDNTNYLKRHINKMINILFVKVQSECNINSGKDIGIK